MYLRSGILAKVNGKPFLASKWARDVIEQIINTILSDISISSKSSDEKLNFYKKLKENIETNNCESFESKINTHIVSIDAGTPSPFKYIPIELKIAIGIYFNNVSTEWEDQFQITKCGENELLRSKTSQVIIGELLREYICLDDSVYAAVSGDGDPVIIRDICSELSKFSIIVCQRTASVTEAGKRQWVRLQYAHESHWDEKRMHIYMNHPNHGVRIPGSNVGAIFFRKKEKDQNVRDIKEMVRKLLNSYPRSGDPYPHVHVTDTHLEAKWVANAMLNQNSIDWMNRACDNYPKKFSILFSEYRKEMSLRNDESNFCLDTGGVMALHGIRDTGDIDYISIGDSEKPIVNDRIEKHNSQYKGYSKSVRELIENPHYHFYYKNIKSSTIKEVLSFKSFRAQVFKSSPSAKKDRDDIFMIGKYLNIFSKSQIPNKKENSNVLKKREDGLKLNLFIRKASLVLSLFPLFATRTIIFLAKKTLPSKIIQKIKQKRNSLRQKWKLRLRKRIPNTLG
jgi:hypothetical protein